MEKLRHWEIKMRDKETVKSEYYKDVDSEDENAIVFGVCNYMDSTIYINKEMSHMNKHATIIHELVHALMFEYNVSTGNEAEDIPSFVDSYYQEIREIHKIASEITVMSSLNDFNVGKMIEDVRGQDD